MSKRIGIGKTQRFRIFARDNFTCRYCGKTSENAVLEVDHMIPVAQNGTNDDDNLITACFDCNHGKAAKTVDQTAVPGVDHLRRAQECNEQLRAARAAKKAALAEDKTKTVFFQFFEELTGRDSMSRGTYAVLMSYVRNYGPELAFGWMRIARDRFGPGISDTKMGKYVSGCRRRHDEELLAESEPTDQPHA